MRFSGGENDRRFAAMCVGRGLLTPPCVKSVSIKFPAGSGDPTLHFKTYHYRIFNGLPVFVAALLRLAIGSIAVACG